MIFRRSFRIPCEVANTFLKDVKIFRRSFGISCEITNTFLKEVKIFRRSFGIPCEITNTFLKEVKIFRRSFGIPCEISNTFLKEVKISIRNLPSEITITFTAKLFNYVLEPSPRSIKINYPAVSRPKQRALRGLTYSTLKFMRSTCGKSTYTASLLKQKHVRAKFP